MAAVLTTPLWFLWKPTEVWAWALFLGLAFVAGLFVILGVMAWSAGPPAVQSKKMEPEFITGS